MEDIRLKTKKHYIFQTITTKLDPDTSVKFYSARKDQKMNESFPNFSAHKKNTNRRYIRVGRNFNGNTFPYISLGASENIQTILAINIFFQLNSIPFSFKIFFYLNYFFPCMKGIVRNKDSLFKI